eukprot:8946060-Alexandrium_andersonii.AAC.1
MPGAGMPLAGPRSSAGAVATGATGLAACAPTSMRPRRPLRRRWPWQPRPQQRPLRLQRGWGPESAQEAQRRVGWNRIGCP